MHSKVVGGSNAHRRLACPGSMDLEARMPDEESPYAAEGTALHNEMEALVDEDHITADHRLGEQSGAIPALTQEHIDVLNWCLHIANDQIGSNEYDLETWGDFPGIKDAGGTADVVIIRDSELVILDYKFGRGVPVSAKDNKQGMFYALCVINKFDLWEEIEQVTFHILQPRLDSHTQDTWTISTLDKFGLELARAIDKAKGSTEYIMGSWCRFCKGRAICPAQMQQAQDAYNWRQVAAEDLPKAMAMVEDLEDWCAEVRRRAHSALEAGAQVQGWKLVAKRAIRKWALTDDDVLRYLKKAGLKLDQAAPRKVISPAAAEKLLGDVKPENVSATSSGTTIVHESDKRPAIDKGSRDLGALNSIIEKGG